MLLPNIIRKLTPLARVKSLGMCVHKALLYCGYQESEKSRVACDTGMVNCTFIYLEGGTVRDKAVFLKCIYEFFEEIDNQWYFLVRQRRKKSMHGYFAVPELLAKRKKRFKCALE